VEDAEGRLVEGGVDPLPFPGGVAVAEGGHHPEGREEPRQVVGIDGRGARGGTIGGAIQIPRAAEGGSDGREARALAQWPRLAEGGDARHDQRRPELAEILPAEPPGLEDAGPEVLDDHVAHRHEAAHDLLPLRRVQIEGDDLLASVVDGPPVVGAVLGGAETAEVVALAGQLRLDHLGAELGHESAAERAGHDLRQLEDADARERQGAIRHGEGGILADAPIVSSPRGEVPGEDSPALTTTLVGDWVRPGRPNSEGYEMSRFSTFAVLRTPIYVARLPRHGRPACLSTGKCCSKDNFSLTAPLSCPNFRVLSTLSEFHHDAGASMGDVSMANLLTKQSLPTKDGFAHAVRFTVASAAAQTVPAKGRIISLHSRSHAVGARGSRVFSLVLLLFLVFPVSTSTSADATCPLPEALPLIFGLNTGQT